jgi:hypothetical protein
LFLKFLTYFWGPIPWMIEAVVILSAVARHWPDFAIILLLLVANTIVGFWEENEAGNAIEALKAKLAVKARMKQDEKRVTRPARELMPGDIIRLHLGDIVPADARLLEGDEVEVDQSALQVNRYQLHLNLVRQCFQVQLFDRVKSVHWSMPQVRTPFSAKQHNWYRKRTQSATFSVPY